MALLTESEPLRGAASRRLDAVVVVRGALDGALCARWTAAVLAARAEWTSDFDGEQFSLGRAFYTHLETDRAASYFADAAASNEHVERHAPGLQGTLRQLMTDATEACVVARPGWCGAGVHVFPARGVLARRGGVVHSDTEGLADHHVARAGRALSLVVMLQPPARGGGLRVWSALHDGRDELDASTLGEGSDGTVVLGAGDVVLFESYRVHQIQPFDGPLDRISATLHAAEIDRGLWEAWF